MNIFVNATAATYGGVYKIVEQFLESIFKLDTENTYYVFVSNDNFDKYNNKNVIIVKIKGKKWMERIAWDFCGMKKWSKKNEIVPQKIISLQNTAVNFDNKDEIIYLHTSLPFTSDIWNPFKKDERLLWLYKNIYPFFIKAFLNDHCTLVVQTNWMKEIAAKKLKIPLNKIVVIRPDIKIKKNRVEISEPKTLSNERVFFYPAMDYVYKNHIVIIKALSIIKKNEPSLFQKIKVKFTLSKESVLYKKACRLQIEDSIDFLGTISFNEVQNLYRQADVILFPSYIETAGLPLIEAAIFKKLIICSDEPFAKEMLGDYKGVTYIPAKNVNEWVTAIINQCRNQNTCNDYHFEFENSNSWSLFHDLINSCNREFDKKNI